MSNNRTSAEPNLKLFSFLARDCSRTRRYRHWWKPCGIGAAIDAMEVRKYSKYSKYSKGHWSAYMCVYERRGPQRIRYLLLHSDALPGVL